MSVLFGAREAGCFREVAALHSGHLRQVPLYTHLHSTLAPMKHPHHCTYVTVTVYGNNLSLCE